jgi:hypothetical protein
MNSNDNNLQFLCHCVDCNRLTGSVYSTNLLVPINNVSVDKGQPKIYSKPADGGATITSYFCGDCGSTIYRVTPTFKDMAIVKAGMFSEFPRSQQEGKWNVWEAARPKLEIFTSRQVDWIEKFKDTERLIAQEGL